MKTLVLITSQYPFGTGEPFVDTELQFLSKEYERIIIISQNTSLPSSRRLPANVKVFRYDPSTSLAGFLKLPFLLITDCKRINSLMQNEIAFRKKAGSSTFKLRPAVVLKRIIKSLQLLFYIRDVLKKEDLSENIVFYSYWFNTGAHAICHLDNNGCIRIARGHGSDLYEERSPGGFLPLMNLLSESLDGLFFVSDNGREYFISRTGADPARCYTSRLGVLKPEISGKQRERHETFEIVSCSNLVPLKRVDRIIEALGIINTGRKISWTHFGSGHLLDTLTELAQIKLSSKQNISFRFAGQVPNAELLRFYNSSRPDLFINVSSTEGAPVSIMEAQAFGIPVVATNVGGVSEIINESTGVLLDPDFSIEELKDRILDFINMSDEERSGFSARAVSGFELKYDASVNYPDFIKKVNIILAARNNE